MFDTANALEDFEANELAFEAGASAVALKAGAAASAKYNDKGVVVFTKPVGGLMFDASIGGQQFTFQPAEQSTPGATMGTPPPSGGM